MTRTILGRIALVFLALGVLGVIAGALDPHGGHPPSGFFLLAAFLLLPLAALFSVLHFLVAAFDRERTSNERASAAWLAAGIALGSASLFAAWMRRGSILVSLAALVLIGLGLGVRRKGRPRG